MDTIITRVQYARFCEAIGLDPISEEQAILSAGREFLPDCAQAVLAGGEATEGYWAFLAEQTAVYVFRQGKRET